MTPSVERSLDAKYLIEVNPSLVIEFLLSCTHVA